MQHRRRRHSLDLEAVLAGESVLPDGCVEAGADRGDAGDVAAAGDIKVGGDASEQAGGLV